MAQSDPADVLVHLHGVNFFWGRGNVIYDWVISHEKYRFLAFGRKSDDLTM